MPKIRSDYAKPHSVIFGAQEKDNYGTYNDVFNGADGTCDPRQSVCATAVLNSSSGSSGSATTTLPQAVDLADKQWRELTIGDRQVIPAGYTYIGQLIGHDLGSSVRPDHVPYISDEAESSAADSGVSKKPTGYNLIEHPLTLETIYGAGPTMLPHLYHSDSFLFRVKSKFVLSIQHVREDATIRALYDPRNRDTIMLHRMVVVLMKFHNAVAVQIHQIMENRKTGSLPKKGEVFGLARAHVLSVWHELVEKEFLPQFVDPEIMSMSSTKLKDFNPIDRTTLLHGLFRAFHCLPRSAYRLDNSSGQPLRELLRKNPPNDDDQLEQAGWSLLWEMFFDPSANGTKTGICTSVSSALSRKNGLKIFEMDLASASKFAAMKYQHEAIGDIIEKLESDWPSSLSAEALAKEFTEKFAVKMGWEVTPKNVENSPLFFILMMEAQLRGTDGSFGPLGSIMLRRSIMNLIENSEFPKEDKFDGALPRPKSFIELLNNYNT